MSRDETISVFRDHRGHVVGYRKVHHYLEIAAELEESADEAERGLHDDDAINPTNRAEVAARLRRRAAKILDALARRDLDRLHEIAAEEGIAGDLLPGRVGDEIWTIAPLSLNRRLHLGEFGRYVAPRPRDRRPRRSGSPRRGSPSRKPDDPEPPLIRRATA